MNSHYKNHFALHILAYILYPEFSKLQVFVLIFKCTQFPSRYVMCCSTVQCTNVIFCRVFCNVFFVNHGYFVLSRVIKGQVLLAAASSAEKRCLCLFWAIIYGAMYSYLLKSIVCQNIVLSFHRRNLISLPCSIGKAFLESLVLLCASFLS